MNTFGSTYTLTRSSFASYPPAVAKSLYRQAYREACVHFDCKAKIDDGNGGTGWKFFETRAAMRTWKNQK